MSKVKIVLIAIGGVAAVAALALGYLIWSASSANSDRAFAVEDSIQSAGRLMASPVHPGPEALKDLASNRTVCVDWAREAVEVAARGNRAYEPTTPPAFKTFIADEARRLSALPGGAEGGHLVKEGFAFGFSEYISEGKLPADEALPRLQRQWDDIVKIVETLADCGAVEILDLAVVQPKPAAEQAEQQPRRGKRAKAESKGPAVTRETYAVTFLTRPAALVKALNGFAADERFIVVDDFAFAREADLLAGALGAAGKSGEAQAAPAARRGRRARAAEETAEAGEEEKKGVVTDPLKTLPFRVTMTVSVCDFSGAVGTEAKDAEKKEEAK